MKRGKLFRTPISQRQRVSYVAEFLDWCYAAGRTTDWIEGTFWDWFLRAAPDVMRETFRKKRGPIRRTTAEWDWPEIQKLARAAFEDYAKGGDAGALLDLGSVSFVLTTWTGTDGKSYLHYGTPANVALNEQAVLVAALTEVLCDLRGLAVEALGECAKCGRYFIRFRAERRIYCSPRCNALAARARGMGRAASRKRIRAKRVKR